MNHFKPCPFCAGKPIVAFEKGEFKLSCTNCPAYMYWFAAEEDAVAAWNKRDCGCDEAEYFERGVELAINVLERHKKTAEIAGGKDSAAYRLIQEFLEEIDAHLEYALSPL